MPINFHCECGKPFWTADANAGRRMVCTRCGRELVVPMADGRVPEGIVFIDAETARISRKAVISLVLGISAFILGPFLGIPAVIFGAVGRSEINRDRFRLKGLAAANWGIILGCLGTFTWLVVGLGLTASRDAHQTSRRSQCINNLKSIGLALHNYHSVYRSFPPSAIVDKHGRPLLSWRVAILTYMEQRELYDQFKLDEPWDSPHNLTLLDKIPSGYLCPSDPSNDTRMTSYQAIVGPGSLFAGDLPTSLDQITDGSSNTLAVVEATVKVPWTKPDDLSIGLIGTGLGSEDTSGSNALFADGSVRFLKKSVSPRILRELGTKAGGELYADDPY